MSGYDLNRLNEGSDDNKKNKFISGNTKLQSFLLEKSSDTDLKTTGKDSANLDLMNFYNNPILIEAQKKVIHEINPEIIKNITSQSLLYKHVESLLNEVCNKHYPTLTNKERSLIYQSLVDELTGFGPIQSLIENDLISEIMINGPSKIYVECKGLISLTNIKFRDSKHVMQVIDKIISPLGRRIDESSPMVDARLPDGSRVNVIIPPLSLTGPVITIRKFSAKPLTIDHLVNYETLSEKMAKYLKSAVEARANIIVAGGTGSGKTTFLNVLSSFIPEDERIISIEDAAELKLMQPHVISLESRPANIEGKGEITIRDLVRNSLRMRPNRIIVGEVRGAETLDMLQAMNTGHNGSLSTIHANSPRDALTRLETMVLLTGIDFPLKAIREQIFSAIDLIVYVERFANGSRKITHITEVSGMESDIILLQDIFYFEKQGKMNGKVRGEFKQTSIRPKLADKFDSLGI